MSTWQSSNVLSIDSSVACAVSVFLDNVAGWSVLHCLANTAAAAAAAATAAQTAADAAVVARQDAAGAADAEATKVLTQQRSALLGVLVQETHGRVMSNSLSLLLPMRKQQSC